MARMEQDNRDIIQEFIDMFKCYTLNEDIVDSFPNTSDHWIYMDKQTDCYDEDGIELEWENYCIYDIEEDIRTHQDGLNVCVSRTLEWQLWNLDDSCCPSITNGVEYIEYDSSYNPNIDIIVMDSGIDFEHPQFEGITTDTLYNHYDASEGLNNHGTHVAGTIIGKDYGAFRAKNTQIKLLDVRIFDSFGYGTGSAEFIGFDAIINYLDNNPGKKVIINMSFGGGALGAIGNARLIKIKEKGGFMFSAAGNENIDAMYYFPAESNHTITVGATNKDNDKADFSNYGSVDIWAPGIGIKSSLPGGESGYKFGTSMAAPLVAGIAANILANNPGLDFDGIKQRLLDYAVYDVSDFQGRTNLPRVQISCKEYGLTDSYSSIKTLFDNIDINGMYSKVNDNNNLEMIEMNIYILWIIGVLSVVTIICLIIYCFNIKYKSGNQGYKIVEYDWESVENV